MRFHVMHRTAAVLTALTVLTFAPQAQSLPPPAKTVFKCEENGKVVYSDSPCLGAKTVDVEPPRGVSRLSGQERVGSAVQQERLREHIADAMRPLTGMNPKQYETFGRRQKLPADTRGSASGWMGGFRWWRRRNARPAGRRWSISSCGSSDCESASGSWRAEHRGRFPDDLQCRGPMLPWGRGRTRSAFNRGGIGRLLLQAQGQLKNSNSNPRALHPSGATHITHISPSDP